MAEHRHPRLPPRLDRVFARTPLYFVTFCTYRRRHLLANAPVHAAFRAFAERAYVEHNIAVGRYVIMPDHVHLFVCGGADFRLSVWVGLLKQTLAKSACSRLPVASVSRSGDALDAPPIGRRLQKASHTIWQRGFFDHVLRSDESYGQKWNYVRDNPVRGALAPDADAWPYAGEIIYIDRA